MKIVLVLLSLAVLPVGYPTGQADVGDEIRSLIAEARHPWARRPDFPRYVDVMARLYAARADAPLWVIDGSLSPAGHAAISELLAASDQGLDPADYDVVTLEGMTHSPSMASWNAPATARFDLLLTLGLVRFLDDETGGRQRPGPFGHDRAPPSPDLAAAIANAARGDSVAALVHALQPRLAQFRNLRAHLTRYRRLAADTPFVRLPAARSVAPGDDYAAEPALERRLLALGDLSADAERESGGRYEGPVVEAVRRFQGRHALEPDATLGPSTFAALNVPYSDRVEQIELALERLRALPSLGGRRLIVVNIPAFRLFAFDSVGGTGAPSLQMNVVAGKALDTRTPLLFEELRYVEFRPYWNVPRGILVKEILPLLRRQPSYLRAHDMEVVAPPLTVLGDDVTPDVLRGLAGGVLRVRQRPGPRNALGLAKFVFPNAAAVYMHGTPETELFSRTRRDFSHGCIRLADPVALAAWVLRDQTGWDRPAIEAAMNAAGPSRAPLIAPITVVVFYTTAVAAPGGTIFFYPDVYGHDRELRERLHAGADPVF